MGEIVNDTGTVGAIFVDAQGLEVVDHFAPSEALEDVFDLTRAVGRHEHGDRLPDDLFRGVAIEFLGAQV
jgi:hypothetical protein